MSKTHKKSLHFTIAKKIIKQKGKNETFSRSTMKLNQKNTENGEIKENL